MKKLALVLCLSFIASLSYAEDVMFTPSEVKDSRTTGQFFAGLEIKVKAIGDNLAEARAMKLNVTKAVDDTGRDLLKKDDWQKSEFTKTNESSTGQAEIEIKLKNPSRKASVVKQLTGELTLFIPGRDPGATATIESFMSFAGKPVANKTLKSAGVAIAIMTKKQFEDFKEQQKKEMKEKEGEMVKEFGEAMAKALGSLFSGFMEIGENSVILNVSDPGSKVIDMEFVDAAGAPVRSNGSMRTGDTRVYEFEKPMPQGAALKLYLATSKAMVTSTFSMSDIVLP